jgi:hypothetical protein
VFFGINNPNSGLRITTEQNNEKFRLCLGIADGACADLIVADPPRRAEQRSRASANSSTKRMAKLIRSSSQQHLIPFPIVAWRNSGSQKRAGAKSGPTLERNTIC